MRVNRGPQISSSDLQAFCLFIGYPRSGHSLVGSFLDAHPDIALGHEARAMKRVAVGGWSQAQIVSDLVTNAAEQASRKTGRTQSGYFYEVPGQWQGRVRKLVVCGDKGGGDTSRRLAVDPSELRKFADAIEVPLRLVHVMRNPYDIVARIARVTRGGVPKQTLDEAILRFSVLALANGAVLESDAFVVSSVRHEDVVAKPQAELRRLCEFLGIEPTADYLESCASIVWEKPHQTRRLVEWSDTQVDRLRMVIDQHPFLAGYSFDGPS
ncbi:MAG TPA: sulfotransferase [Gaiellaceae bacterium]